MKTRNYRYGTWNLKAYQKTVGHGYEVGFTWGTKTIFVGNFVHAKEANAWWTILNKEVRTFTKRFWATPKTSQAFYSKFLANHLYKYYYSFLDKQFSRYNTTYRSAYTKSERQYKRFQKNWDKKAKTALRAA